MKYQEGILNVGTEVGYTIAVALNGPGCERLRVHKWAVTARFRAYCGTDDSQAAVRRVPLTYGDADALRREIQWLRGIYSWIDDQSSARMALQEHIGHWAHHAYSAVVRLRARLVMPNDSLLRSWQYLHLLSTATNPYLNSTTWLQVAEAVFPWIIAEQEARPTFDQFLWTRTGL